MIWYDTFMVKLNKWWFDCLEQSIWDWTHGGGYSHTWAWWGGSAEVTSICLDLLSDWTLAWMWCVRQLVMQWYKAKQLCSVKTRTHAWNATFEHRVFCVFHINHDNTSFYMYKYHLHNQCKLLKTYRWLSMMVCNDWKQPHSQKKYYYYRYNGSYLKTVRAIAEIWNSILCFYDGS